MAALSQHPARIAAKKAGETRFVSDTPCPRYLHLVRYTDTLLCAECMDMTRARRNRIKALAEAEVEFHEAEDDENEAARIYRNRKFLVLLHEEALNAVRSPNDQ